MADKAPRAGVNLADQQQEIAGPSNEQRVLLEQRLLDQLAKRDASSRTIPRAARSDQIPLSSAQQRLWIIDQIEPGLPTYNVGRTYRLQGALDVVAVERTLAALVARHEPLRTNIRSQGGKPYQVIQSGATLVLDLKDLTELSAPTREVTAGRLAREERQRPFDLANDLMLRACLIRFASDDYYLIVTIHHIATDGWSERIFWREFGTLYSGFVRGEDIKLPDLPVRYADYAVWQQQRLSSEEMASQLDFWSGQLADVAPLELTTDYPRPDRLSWHADDVSFQLAPSLGEQLRDLARRESVTPYMLLLAVFQVLLYRYSNQYVFAIGTTIAGRNSIEIEPLVGFFVNTLALRADLTGDPIFRTLLRRVRHTTVQAFDHQDLPFDRLVGALQPQRQLNRHPLFQVLFQLSPQNDVDLEMPDILVERIDIGGDTAKFDLLLSMSENDKALRGRFTFSTDLFATPTIERLAEHFTNLLQEIVADADKPISQYHLQTEAEWQQVISGWNLSVVDYPRDASLQQLFEHQVSLHPDSIALHFEDAEISYGDLNRRANRIAHALCRRGIQSNVPIGLWMRRTPDMIASMLGILKAGAAYFPLEPNSPAARLAFMLEDSGAQLILTDGMMRAKLPPTAVKTLGLDELIATTSAMEQENPPIGASSGDLAYVMYTSGSTGNPKAVAIAQRSVVRLVHAPDYVELGPQETLLHLATPAFDVATFEIWGALLHGSPLVLGPDGLPDYVELEALIRRHGVSVIWLTAGLFNSVIDNHPQMLATVRQILTGGEALSVAHIRRAQQLLPQSTFVNGYGPTENTTFTCCYRIPRPLPEKLRSIPIGRPVPATQVYVLDEHLKAVPVGIVGELCAGGEGLARGYLNRPELNAERFIDNPFQPGTRLYRTGDLVRWLPDGNLEFIGRNDSQVKLRGYRIELGEIQTKLDHHPSVRNSVVVLEKGPAADSRLVAYYVPIDDQTPTTSELKAFLEASLPTYMIPSVFLALNNLPLTANGKIDYAKLDGVPATTQTTAVAESVRLTPVEEALAAIFCEVLSLDHVGIHDDFFALGGHSLLAAQVIARFRMSFDVEIRLRTLFERPTVAELADFVTAGPARSLDAPASQDGSAAPPDNRFRSTAIQGSTRPYALPRTAIESESQGPIRNYAPPRNQIETELARSWSAILGIEEIGIYDRFFDLGGNSLSGIQLVSEIGALFGISLSPSVLFEAQTISELAILLQQRQTERQWKSLVPIQSHGDRAPFFCVHGFGGGVLGYADLACALGEEQPFYGLQAVGLDGELQPDDTIEAMAAHYIVAMRAVQPKGPYRIGGYCFGGVVAFEMARQLGAIGETASLVAIIEGNAPGQFQRRQSTISPQRWLAIWRDLPYWLSDYWELGADGLRRQTDRKLRHWRKDLRHRLGQKVEFDAQDMVPDDLSTMPQHLRRLMDVHLGALRTYYPEPIDSPITLFAARGRTISAALFGSGDPERGWGTLTRRGVEIKIVEGGHRNLHLEPYVVTLAAALEASLRSQAEQE